MKKIKKILLVIIVLDYVKLNLWQIYNINKRVKNGEEPIVALRKQCAYWKDDIKINT